MLKILGNLNDLIFKVDDQIIDCTYEDMVKLVLANNYEVYLGEYEYDKDAFCQGIITPECAKLTNIIKYMIEFEIKPRNIHLLNSVYLSSMNLDIIKDYVVGISLISSLSLDLFPNLIYIESYSQLHEIPSNFKIIEEKQYVTYYIRDDMNMTKKEYYEYLQNMNKTIKKVQE